MPELSNLVLNSNKFTRHFQHNFYHKCDLSASNAELAFADITCSLEMIKYKLLGINLIKSMVLHERTANHLHSSTNIGVQNRDSV